MNLQAKKELVVPIGSNYNNSMLDMKEKLDITWMPPLRTEGLSSDGWILVNGEQFLITDWYSFDDFGQTLETVTAKSVDDEEIEVYSFNEGQTWCDELD